MSRRLVPVQRFVDTFIPGAIHTGSVMYPSGVWTLYEKHHTVTAKEYSEVTVYKRVTNGLETYLLYQEKYTGQVKVHLMKLNDTDVKNVKEFLVLGDREAVYLDIFASFDKSVSGSYTCLVCDV